jgi:hypothetical protein
MWAMQKFRLSNKSNNNVDNNKNGDSVYLQLRKERVSTPWTYGAATQLNERASTCPLIPRVYHHNSKFLLQTLKLKNFRKSDCKIFH